MKIISKLAIFAVTLMCATPAKAEVKLGITGEEAASIGIYIKDLATGNVLVENDSRRALLPASVMKSMTAACALTYLSEDFRFETPVYLYGRKAADSASTWEGNLVIESCGDPTIDSENFDDRPTFASEIIKGLTALGIRTITGNIVVNQSMQQAGCVPSWEISDAAWAYGAGIYGFNYRDNVVSVWPATGETRPYVPGLNVTTHQDADGTDLLRGINSDELIVYGKDPTNPKWRLKTSMDNPAEVFKADLADRLQNANITLKGKQSSDYSTRLQVCVHQSPRLVEMLTEMMYESHNLFAEGMLRALVEDGTRVEAIDQAKSILRSLGVSTSYNKISDGSGLARNDRLQPIFISRVFEAMAKGNKSSTYVSIFPKAGVEGTVKGLLEKTRLKGMLALKSGSMDGVQCFAGYKLDADGAPTHTVVILVNGFFCSRGELRGAIENLLLNTFKD